VKDYNSICFDIYLFGVNFQNKNSAK